MPQPWQVILFTQTLANDVARPPGFAEVWTREHTRCNRPGRLARPKGSPAPNAAAATATEEAGL